MAKKKGSKKKSYVGAKTCTQVAKPVSIADSINTEAIITEALSAAYQPNLLKVCRLCESKDGPFLNIFDADKVIAKKIDNLMPFGIQESDELPHKICFRCSAKVEELYEFVQKCIRTQESLRKAAGNLAPVAKTKITSSLWEEQLNKSNISNDDICDALIKKAMEGIRDIPLNPVPIEKEVKIKLDRAPIKDTIVAEKKEIDVPKKDHDSMHLKNLKMQQIEPKMIYTRTSRSANVQPSVESTKAKPAASDDDDDNLSILENFKRGTKRKAVTKESPEPEAPKKEEQNNENKTDKKPFDIMDHISMIKVNGVGVLFQCKLCNRNFLKKEVVMSHACAKYGGPKQEAVPDYLPPVPPKVPVVKYINTKTDSLHSKPAVVNEKPIILDDEPPTPAAKPKPKAGPASRVKRKNEIAEKDDPSPNTQIRVTANLSSQITAPTIQFPSMPSLNSRYKLVPGPNNTFTLIEEKVTENSEYVSSDDSNSGTTKNSNNKSNGASKSKKGESSNDISKKTKLIVNSVSSRAVEVKSGSSDRPYPVGLIKKVGNNSNDYTTTASDSIAFTTPAMKKQSYTIVQTGNPSKLLISTKPQTVQEDVSKKKVRKETRKEPAKQPFSVTLEDAAPPKDPAFFTFINVDPLLQPSYVLPTDNIIQESQISTSTPASNSQAPVENKNTDKDKYKCNMCGEQFSREKKLFTHINSHYNKMDEEDQLREKAKKRAKKS